MKWRAVGEGLSEPWQLDLVLLYKSTEIPGPYVRFFDRLENSNVKERKCHNEENCRAVIVVS